MNINSERDRAKESLHSHKFEIRIADELTRQVEERLFEVVVAFG
jgi:hypothetical protein